jgi:hypothetical protein
MIETGKPRALPHPPAFYKRVIFSFFCSVSKAHRAIDHLFAVIICSCLKQLSFLQYQLITRRAACCFDVSYVIVRVKKEPITQRIHVAFVCSWLVFETQEGQYIKRGRTVYRPSEYFK